MTQRSVAIFAHRDYEQDGSITASELLLLASTLMGHGIRLALDAPPSVLLPVLAASRSYAAGPLLEGAEAGPPPITLMRRLKDPSLESGLYREAVIERGEDTYRESLVGQFEALGQVDATWRSDEPPNFFGILEKMNVGAVVAMGWSREMKETLDAIQEFHKATQVPLLFAGSQTGYVDELPSWQPLKDYVELEELDLEPLRVEERDTREDERWGDEDRREEAPEFSDDYRQAWKRAMFEASIVLQAERLAKWLNGDDSPGLLVL